MSDHDTQMTLRPVLKVDDRTALAKRLSNHMRVFYQAKKYDIDDYIEPMITLLGSYGADDPYFEDCRFGQDHGLSLKKGICLAGPVGSSKTTLLEALNYALQQEGSGWSYIVLETKELAVAYGREKEGGLPAIKALLNPKHNRHAYYDEIGKVSIAEVRHFSTTANIDHLVIEFREDLYKKARILTHFTTNMTEQVLESWLTAKYISRFRMMVNYIPYNNKTDYRTVTPARGPREAAEVKPETFEKEEYHAQVLSRFIKEVEKWHATKVYQISDEDGVYEALVTMKHLPGGALDMKAPEYLDALDAAKEVVNNRLLLYNSDRHKRRELKAMLDNMQPGNAHTSDEWVYIRKAIKAIRVRCFTYENLGSKFAIDRVFPIV